MRCYYNTLEREKMYRGKKLFGNRDMDAYGKVGYYQNALLEPEIN